MLMTSLVACGCLSTEPVRIDLDAESQRQVIVDHEAAVYLGHVSTALLDDGQSILAVYPKGHGKGPIILKRSQDGGRTWGDRLAVPESWASSKETPTLFNLGGGSLIMFSGLYPIRAARSEDEGKNWSELSPIGDFGGIVAMGGLAKREDGSLVAFFHDDGRFIKDGGKATGTFTLYQTESKDRGRTWSAPRSLWSGSAVHLCEPGFVKSPDGATWALLLRENRRVKNSHVMFSRDQAATWTEPRELPTWLTGDRHIAAYATAPDGRLVVTFRCMADGDPWKGDWVAWVGTWDDLAGAEPGVDGSPTVPCPTPGAAGRSGVPRTGYLVRLKDNLTDWDCGYAGLESLPDGTLVATTYGTWTKGEEPYILSVRFTLRELDSKLPPIGR